MCQIGNLGEDAGSVRLSVHNLKRVVFVGIRLFFSKRQNLYKNLTKNSKIGLVSDEKSALIYVIFWRAVLVNRETEQELTVRHMCEAGGTKCKKQMKF